MSERGSPSDHTGNDNANPDAGAPASSPADGAASASGSGDANSQADASSASGDQGANKDDKQPTLADVIKTAAEIPDATSGNSPAPAKDGKEKVEGEADAAAKADGEKAEPDDSKLPFHNHPRWKEVVSQKQTLEAKVKDLEPAAEQFGKIESFMQEHHLSHDEVGELFIVGAMAKAGDPRALEKIDAYRDRLALAIGEKLPDDIKEQVESGAITEAAGKELAKSRVTTKRLETDASARAEQDENRRREDDAAKLSSDCRAATAAWEDGIRKTDPDFAKKEKAVARYARALMQEKGFPKSKENAVAIIQEAYDEVNKDFGAVIPPKTPVARVPAAPSSNGAKVEPKSLAEAVRQAANI